MAFDCLSSDSQLADSDSTSDEDNGFPGGMGYGGFSDAAREGYFAGYYWQSSSDEEESNDSSSSEDTDSSESGGGVLRMSLRLRSNLRNRAALHSQRVVADPEDSSSS